MSVIYEWQFKATRPGFIKQERSGRAVYEVHVPPSTGRIMLDFAIEKFFFERPQSERLHWSIEGCCRRVPVAQPKDPKQGELSI